MTVEGSATLDEAAERARLLFPSPIPPGEHRLTPALHRHPERPAARLLPQHLQGRRGRLPRHRGHPVRGHRRPPRLPLLGRARVQGGLRRHAGGRRSGSPRSRNTARGRARRRATGQEGRSVFADTIPMSTYLVAFVVGELEATAAGDGRPDAAARLVRAGQAPPGRVRARDRRLLARATSRSTTACPIPATSSTCSPSPTSRPGRWRTWARSPSARRRCWWTRPRRRTPSASASPTWSPTRSPTCGSATW